MSKRTFEVISVVGDPCHSGRTDGIYESENAAINHAARMAGAGIAVQVWEGGGLVWDSETDAVEIQGSRRRYVYR